MIAAMARGADEGLAGATPYQDLFGYVAAGLYLARGAAAADRLATEDAAQAAYYKSKVQVARFYADNILPRVDGLAPAVMAGADTVAALDPALLSG